MSENSNNSKNQTNTPLSFRNRFTIPPPLAMGMYSQPSSAQGPMLFRPSSGHYFSQPGNLTFPSSASPPVPGNPTTLYFPPSASSSQYSSESRAASPESSSDSSSRGKNWSDQETRYLLGIWRDNFPISKRRNASTWDAIAKELNKQLKDQGTHTFRSGTQCKTRIKSLEDEYKKVKDHNNRSGNNTETCDYYDELDAVLGCKPNITPKHVLECGFADDESSLSTTGEEEDCQDELGANDGNEAKVEKNTNQRKRSSGKGKQPAGKKNTKREKLDDDFDFYAFLKESQEKDHEFFGRLAEKEAERELKSQRMMFDTIKDIAKIFKDSN